MKGTRMGRTKRTLHSFCLGMNKFIWMEIVKYGMRSMTLTWRFGTVHSASGSVFPKRSCLESR